jgi:hypothetical protein
VICDNFDPESNEIRLSDGHLGNNNGQIRVTADEIQWRVKRSESENSETGETTPQMTSNRRSQTNLIFVGTLREMCRILAISGFSGDA